MEHEYWHGITLEDLETLRPLLLEWREACRVVKARPVTRSNRRSPFMGTGEVERWRGLVSVYFKESDINTALCIIKYESGGNPYADNPGSSASGLFQHLGKYWTERSIKAGWAGADIWDPEASTAVAAWLQRTGGWGHWTTYRKCRGL
jgi:hypothetical protein